MRSISGVAVLGGSVVIALLYGVLTYANTIKKDAEEEQQQQQRNVIGEGGSAAFLKTMEDFFDDDIDRLVEGHFNAEIREYFSDRSPYLPPSTTHSTPPPHFHVIPGPQIAPPPLRIQTHPHPPVIFLYQSPYIHPLHNQITNPTPPPPLFFQANLSHPSQENSDKMNNNGTGSAFLTKSNSNSIDKSQNGDSSPAIFIFAPTNTYNQNNNSTHQSYAPVEANTQQTYAPTNTQQSYAPTLQQFHTSTHEQQSFIHDQTRIQLSTTPSPSTTLLGPSPIDKIIPDD